MYCMPALSAIFALQQFAKDWFIYLHLRGAFRCSFRQSGQCEGLSIVERTTEWFHAFFVRTGCTTIWTHCLMRTPGEAGQIPLTLDCPPTSPPKFKALKQRTHTQGCPRTVFLRKNAAGSFSGPHTAGPKRLAPNCNHKK